ncbi:MAG: hypothetical protein HFH40_00715 [Lachnospiraceae bacterium]|nr:hypothetical protein [Lachnospiraceae bacterium]
MGIPELGQVLASAVRYIQDNSGIYAAPYFDKVPEDFIVPSMYFPIPKVGSRKATLSSYCSTLSMECWFMAMDEWEAYRHASGVQRCLLRDGCAIPVVGQGGEASGWSVRATDPEVRKIDGRTVRLSFGLKHYFSFQGEGAEKVDNVNVLFASPGDVYGIWADATTGQRKSEEAQREWLRKAAESL